MFFRQDISRIQFFITEALPTACFGSVPEETQHFIGQIIEAVPVRIVDQEKGDPFLFLKLPHKLYLVFMDILKRKGIRRALLCIEADRDSLYHANVVHRTFLVEISKRDMPARLVDIDGGDGGRHLLDQRQPVFQIFFICPVDQIF